MIVNAGTASYAIPPIQLFVSVNGDSVTASFNPPGPYLTASIELIEIILVSNDSNAGIVGFAATGTDLLGVVSTPHPTPKNPVQRVTLQTNLKHNQLVIFGIFVQVGSKYYFFDPQASNDPDPGF